MAEVSQIAWVRLTRGMEMQYWKHITRLVLLFGLTLVGPVALADYKLNMTPGVTPISHEMYGLHMMVLWICVAIGIVVFSIMFYAIIRHRKSRGYQPASFHENTKLEILWAIIPFVILIALAIPATNVLINMYNDDDPDVNILITGYQWKWKYDYLDDGFSFYSNLSTPIAQIMNEAPKGENYLLEVDKPLVLPVNKKIRFIVTAADVIHSWWVPDFGIKRDAIPGYAHQVWARIEKPGIYRGQCAELCGINHGFMPIVVEVKTEADYQTWLDAQKAANVSSAKAKAKAALKSWSKAELMEKGEASYLSYCSACHQANGQGMPPTFPAMKGSKVATGPVKQHIDIVLHGKSGTAMQAFEGQLSETEIAAIVTYERNAWGNDTGDVVQPIDIAKAKGIEISDNPEADAVMSTADAEEEAKADAAPIADLTKDELMAKGKDVYLSKCAVCHKPDGSGMPPTFPALKDSEICLDDGQLGHHITNVLKGVKGTAMQSFADQLDDTDIAAVITYERNAWNDGKGCTVQPKEIAAGREQ